MDTFIEIHLYGKLRHYAPDPRADRENVVRITFKAGDTVRAALERAGIAEGEICHIFLNGALFSTHNSMAPWLGYRQAQENVHQRETDIALKPGDRLGIFGHDMAALVV